MDDLNSVYHSTQVAMAATEDDGDELELASAVQRIVAWIINRVIEIAMLIPVIGVIVALLWQAQGSKDADLLMTSMMGSLGLVGLLYLVYSGVQVYLMSKYGQSIGKRIMKIRVVTEDGDKAGFVRNVLLRELAYGAICMVIMLGIGFLAELVFGTSDNVMATMAVNGMVEFISYIPTIVCLVMLFLESRNRQTLQDLLAKTYVVQV
ncbi:RDD family protein [Vitreoscilla massiliensis]|uniref:RDD family protein n=1 Tax=Vitreoscilla massiliensis TaxID=1689272 RepID=A0ABY4E3K4_9NEIS|nr:RDD family protein [Vitreoscilla massiliensis]UOO90346.1 RDD family protein [Vitreoscilla massiliensis]